VSEKLEPKPPSSASLAKPHCAWSGDIGKKLKALSNLDLSVRGKPINLYALPEYETKVRNFVSYYKRFRQLFQGLIGVGIASIFLAMLGGVPWLEPYGWLLVGLTLLIFPFAHNPTFQGLSLRISTRLARGIALGCGVMAAFLFF
jgi:hypothetical protein